LTPYRRPIDFMSAMMKSSFGDSATLLVNLRPIDAVHGADRPVCCPELPNDVTQRGNRRERVFFADADYAL
jgi:hypothetical protein